jgi:hypothetical protein
MKKIIGKLLIFFISLSPLKIRNMLGITHLFMVGIQKDKLIGFKYWVRSKKLNEIKESYIKDNVIIKIWKEDNIYIIGDEETQYTYIF